MPFVQYFESYAAAVNQSLWYFDQSGEYVFASLLKLARTCYFIGELVSHYLRVPIETITKVQVAVSDY